MAEPLDPAALGVASALKSLRTRAGLREDRLHGTELALDTLTGLDSVRALINAGKSPERAIVRAVRTAAGTLEPTMSIVADACLRLELSADPVPDPDLYAALTSDSPLPSPYAGSMFDRIKSFRPGDQGE